MSGFFAEVRRESFLIVAMLLLYVVFSAGVFMMAQHRGVPAEAVIVQGSDAHEYVGLAHTMLSEHRFAFSPDASPEVFRTPGYPFFLAALLLTFGSIMAVPIVQGALIVLSGFFIYTLGRRYFSERVGIVAALLFVLDPTVLFLGVSTLSETLYVFLLLLTIILLGYGPRRTIVCITAGAVLGASILVRPAGLYLLPLVLLCTALIPSQTTSRALKSAVVVFAAACCVVIPWMIRNAEFGGRFGLSSISGYNALFYNAELFEAYRTGTSPESVGAEFKGVLGTEDEVSLKSFPYATQEEVLAKALILAHPVGYAYFHLAKTVPFFIGSSLDSVELSFVSAGLLPPRVAPPVNISGSILSGDVSGALSALFSNPLVLLERLFWVVICGFAFLYSCAVLYRRGTNWRFVLLSVLFIGAFAVLTGPVSGPRYRVPAEPFIFLLAAAGVHATITATRRRSPSEAV